VIRRPSDDIDLAIPLRHFPRSGFDALPDATVQLRRLGNNISKTEAFLLRRLIWHIARRRHMAAVETRPLTVGQLSLRLVGKAVFGMELALTRCMPCRGKSGRSQMFGGPDGPTGYC